MKKTTMQPPPTRREMEASPVLRFSPTAWAKLLYLRDRGETEIGWFGISNEEDLLLVEDVITVTQEGSAVSVAFDDEAVADFFEDQVDAGRTPEQFGRIWIHSHPFDSPVPSATDEETFHRVFGGCQWAVMFIVACAGKSYARLRFGVGPGGQVVIPVEVEYAQPFGPSDHDAWDAEYQANINIRRLAPTPVKQSGMGYDADLQGWDGWDGFDGFEKNTLSYPSKVLEELEAMDPAERQLVLDELAIRPDLWEDKEVACVWE